MRRVARASRLLIIIPKRRPRFMIAPANRIGVEKGAIRFFTHELVLRAMHVLMQEFARMLEGHCSRVRAQMQDARDLFMHHLLGEEVGPPHCNKRRVELCGYDVSKRARAAIP